MWKWRVSSVKTNKQQTRSWWMVIVPSILRTKGGKGKEIPKKVVIDEGENKIHPIPMKDANLEEVVVMCRAKARGEAMPRWMVTEVQSQLKEVQDKLRETVTVLKAQQAEQNNRNSQHQALFGIMAEQMLERAERRREEVRERRQEQEERREEEAREGRQERTTTRTRRKTRRGETIW
jgi:hypothetical protein